MASSFIFYDSYREVYNKLSNDDKIKFIDMILSYGLDGKYEPSNNQLIDISFTLIRPTMDTNKSKKDGGKSGGRPKKEENIDKNKPMDKPMVIDLKPMGKPLPIIDVDVDVDKDNNKPYSLLLSDNINKHTNDNKIKPNFTDYQSYKNYYNSLSDEEKKKYQFKGHVIKLTEKDFTTWLNTYDEVKDFTQTLINYDLYLFKQPEEIQKSWFISTSKILENKHVKNGGVLKNAK